MSKLENFSRWWWTTAAVIGTPVLLLILLVGIQRSFFTLTCETAGYACEYSFSRTDAMAEYVGEVLAANPHGDLKLTPRKR